MSEQQVVVTEDASLETEIEALEAAIDPEATANSETEEKGPEGEEAKPKKVGGVAKRISELTANWREEQRTRQRLESMLERELANRQQPKQAIEPVTVDSEPKLEQFKTYEEYVAAVADHRAEQKVAALLARQEEERRNAEVERQREERARSFRERAAAFAATTPDFNEVAFADHVPVTEDMADALNHSDKGPEILYYLGQNVSEAAQIARLPPVQAALEIGRLEAKLSLPQPRTVTKAPPPIAPLSGGQGSLAVDPDKMSSSEWLKWRNDQLRKT